VAQIAGTITNPGFKSGNIRAGLAEFDTLRVDGAPLMRLADLKDVDTTAVGDNEALLYDKATNTFDFGLPGVAITGQDTTRWGEAAVITAAIPDSAYQHKDDVNDSLLTYGLAAASTDTSIVTKRVIALDGRGLRLFEDGGNGITIVDGGDVNITKLLSQQSTAALESGTLSAELLGAGNWTSTGWTGSHPTFTHTTGNITALSNTFPAVVGTSYQIAYTVTGRTAGTVVITLGGQSISISATGAFGPKATTTGNFTVTPTTDFDGTITLSVKSITAYAATYNILDNTGVSTLEIRSSLNTLNNTFIGKGAGQSNTTGNSNINLGTNAGLSNTTGNYNTNLGTNAGLYNTTGSSNINLGRNAGNHASQKVDAVNSIALGNGTYTTASNQVVIGNADVTETLLKGNIGFDTTTPIAGLDITKANTDTTKFMLSLSKSGTVRASIDSLGRATFADSVIAVGFRSTSDGRLKSDEQVIPYGLAEIMAMQPVKYNLHKPAWEDTLIAIHGRNVARQIANTELVAAYRAENEKDYPDSVLTQMVSDYQKSLPKSEARVKPKYGVTIPLSKRKTASVGLIAQELKLIIPEIVPNIDTETDLYGIAYDGLIPVLIKAVQEQQIQIEALKERVWTLEDAAGVPHPVDAEIPYGILAFIGLGFAAAWAYYIKHKAAA